LNDVSTTKACGVIDDTGITSIECAVRFPNQQRLMPSDLTLTKGERMNPYAKTYQSQQVETASQEQILIMLYDGAIRFLNVAKTAWNDDKDLEKYHNYVVKAQRIVFELMTSLDMEIGGEIAQNLFRLYEYLHYQLIQADIKKDATMLDEVLTHLKLLRDTWVEAIDNARKEIMAIAAEEGELTTSATGGNVYSA
jgi:flagellar protein FliS